MVTSSCCKHPLDHHCSNCPTSGHIGSCLKVSQTPGPSRSVLSTLIGSVCPGFQRSLNQLHLEMPGTQPVTFYHFLYHWGTTFLQPGGTQETALHIQTVGPSSSISSTPGIGNLWPSVCRQTTSPLTTGHSAWGWWEFNCNKFWRCTRSTSLVSTDCWKLSRVLDMGDAGGWTWDLLSAKHLLNH